MSLFAAELRLITRSRVAMFSLVLLFLVSALSIWAGFANVARQNATIARAAAAQVEDRAAVAAEYGKPDGDAGYAAYYTFLPTADHPPALAFAALGQRDVQPSVLRIRALGLQQQLYESETVNAELAVPGVFDFAFVLIYLTPLVVIALMHDLVSGEREAWRFTLLRSLPGAGAALWRRRAGLRYLLVLIALLVPFIVGAVLAAAPAWPAFGMAATAAVYAAFWFALSLLIGARIASSTTSAAALLGCWVALTLLLPTLANAAIARGVPVGKGIDLTLAQREIVHNGWDIPPRATFRRFFVHHPEWQGREAFEGRFHWKWYYAIHQVGDEAVAPQVAAYRASLVARERWTERAGWILPGVAAQVLLHRLADTDLAAQFAYQDSIAAFHARLRHFYYPYLFDDQPFTLADFGRLPGYRARASTASWPAAPMIALIGIAAVALALGAMQIGGLAGRPRGKRER